MRDLRFVWLEISTLIEILNRPAMTTATAMLDSHFPVPETPCVPNYGTCGPDDEDD